METLKLSASSLATVRLMPSMAMDPFSTMKRRMAGSAPMRYHTALSSSSMERIVPVPSMCPETICPPKRPPASMARSRFTGLPGRSCPSEERFSVSCITSAEKLVRVKSVTVRHTPLVAMLSPRRTSSSTFEAETVSTQECAPLRMEATRPTSSTMPVNIYFTSHSRSRSHPSWVTLGSVSSMAYFGASTPKPATGLGAAAPPKTFGAI